MIVLSPGFQETWRNFVDQIDALDAAGHDMVAMDDQRAGETDGQPGGLDRGFGVARDVAAVTARAAGIAKEKCGDGGQVLLYGNSMGAGPGVLGAVLMNDAGAVKLEGEPMPRGLSVLQSPFLGATPSPSNREQ